MFQRDDVTRTVNVRSHHHNSFGLERVRARKAQIDMMRAHVTTLAKSLARDHEDLVDAETMLEAQVTELDPRTREILDSILDTRPSSSTSIAVGFPGVSIEMFAERYLAQREKRRLSRLAQIAPEVLPEVQTDDANRNG